MKQISLLILLSVISVFSVFSQTASSDESQKLNRQIAVFYQQGKYDDAIPLAEKVVEIEKKLAKDSETHALALMNLALLHKERARSMKKQNDALPTIAERQKLAGTINESAKAAENLLRESLKIYEKLNRGESLSVAALKTELAWILHNFLMARTTEEARARIDEAEKLYTEALATQEKASAAQPEAMLKTMLAFGDFYTRWINFEKALPFYERYVATVTAKYGQNSKALVPALRGMLEILVITDRPSEAAETAKLIAGITGREEKVPLTKPNLALRARKMEKVNLPKFFPPDYSNNPGAMFSYGVGAGGISPMGVMKIKSVQVGIVVDENGDVVEAVAEDNSKNKQAIEEAARKSKFRPFVYKGTPQKMRGSLSFAYAEN